MLLHIQCSIVQMEHAAKGGLDLLMSQVLALIVGDARFDSLPEPCAIVHGLALQFLHSKTVVGNQRGHRNSKRLMAAVTGRQWKNSISGLGAGFGLHFWAYFDHEVVLAASALQVASRTQCHIPYFWVRGKIFECEILQGS